MTEMMQGAHTAIKFVTDYLKSDLPSRLVLYRNEWGLDDMTLPMPVKILTYEPMTMDEWPTVYTVVVSTNSMVKADYTYEEAWEPMYRVTYSVRTYVWCSSGDVEAEEDDDIIGNDPSEVATLMRNRLTTVLRSALLDHQCLQAAGNTRQDTVVDESSIQEQFSDLTLLKGQRVMCGAYLSYDINLYEVVARATVGEVEEFEITIGTILETP